MHFDGSNLLGNPHDTLLLLNSKFLLPLIFSSGNHPPIVNPSLSKRPSVLFSSLHSSPQLTQVRVLHQPCSFNDWVYITSAQTLCREFHLGVCVHHFTITFTTLGTQLRQLTDPELAELVLWEHYGEWPDCLSPFLVGGQQQSIWYQDEDFSVSYFPEQILNWAPFMHLYTLRLGFPGGIVIKNPPAKTRDARDMGLIPGSQRSPGVGNGNPLQYSCLENSMDRGAWWSIVHWVSKSKTLLTEISMCVMEHTHTHTHTHILSENTKEIWITTSDSKQYSLD